MNDMNTTPLLEDESLWHDMMDGNHPHKWISTQRGQLRWMATTSCCGHQDEAVAWLPTRTKMCHFYTNQDEDVPFLFWSDSFEYFYVFSIFLYFDLF